MQLMIKNIILSVCHVSTIHLPNLLVIGPTDMEIIGFETVLGKKWHIFNFVPNFATLANKIYQKNIICSIYYVSTINSPNLVVFGTTSMDIIGFEIKYTQK